MAQSRIAHSSVRSFSTGVPVSATRRAADRAQRPRGRRPGFFTCWASSATTRSPPDGAEGLGGPAMVPYVVSTNPSPAPDRSRALPWNLTTGVPGANRRTSASQLPSRLAGQTTRVGRCGQPPRRQVEAMEGDGLAQAHVVGEGRRRGRARSVGQPGQAVELVVAQRRVERGGRRDRLPGGGVREPVADLPAGSRPRRPAPAARPPGRSRSGAAATASTGRTVRTSRLRAFRAIAGSTTVQLPRSRREGRGRLREPVHLLGREQVAVDRELPVEGEEGLGAEGSARPGALARSGSSGRSRHAVQDRGRRQVAPQAPGQSTSTPAAWVAHADVEQADDLVGVQADLVGDPHLQQPVQHRPRRPRRSAIVAWVRARSPKPCSSGIPVHSSARSQRWSGLRSSWACGPAGRRRRPAPRRPPRGATPRPAAGARAVDRVGAAPAVPADAPSKVGRCGRRTGSAVVVGAPRGIASVTASIGSRTRRSSSGPSASIVMRSSSSASRRAARQWSPAGANLPAATRRMASSTAPGQQADGRVQVVASPRLRQHGQRRADRQGDRPPRVRELDHALARRLGRPERGRAGHRDEAHVVETSPRLRQGRCHTRHRRRVSGWGRSR